MKLVAALLALVAGALAGELLVRWKKSRNFVDWAAAQSSAVVPQAEVTRWTNAIEGEFGDAGKFRSALALDHTSERRFREKIAQLLAVEEWIEQRITPKLQVSPGEIANYYAAHRPEFTEPARADVRHLFTAAPVGYPAEVVTEKQEIAEESLARLRAGEKFSELTKTVSEDEGTKNRGGELGWISRVRIPAEFFQEIEKLPPGGPPALFRSHLGFHVAQVLAREPERALSLGEARAEIEARLRAEKRVAAVEELQRDWPGSQSSSGAH